MAWVYKIIAAEAWAAAEAAGVFCGAAIDLADGYIHLSAANQAEETARRHFQGQNGLVLVAFTAESLPGLVWEPSRGGQLFPHVHGPILTAAALWVKPLPWTGETHAFPAGWQA